MSNETKTKKNNPKNNDEQIIEIVISELGLIPDVVGLKGSITDNIHKSIMGTNPQSSGIKTSYDEKEGYSIDLYLVVAYLTQIPQLAWEIQTRIKKALLNNINIKVKNINIHIQGTAKIEEEQ